MATTEPIRNKEQIKALANYYLGKGELRNYVLIVMGIHTALRISDLLSIRWEDVYDFKSHRVRHLIIVTEKKTGKTKTIALNGLIISALTAFACQGAKQGNYLIRNERTGKSISRTQAYRLIRAAADALGFDGRISCHSLRKTFGYHAWKSGVSPAVIMEIFNHSSLTVTRRYLGITQEDLNEVYLNLSLL